MNANCQEFRRLLERELSAATAPELTTLSWHEHLLGCERCRELLRAEEALEVLLESLPQPKLPPDLARRVLARLRAAHAKAQSSDHSVDRGLDQLLDLDELTYPSGLSDKILSALKPERERQHDPLDALLDRNVVQAPSDLKDQVLAGLDAERFATENAGLDRVLERDRVQVPIGLPNRTLRALEAERGLEPAQASAGGKILFFERTIVRGAIATAAGVLAFIAAWSAFSSPPREPRVDNVALADPQLLQDYFVLDNFDILMSDDVDIVIASTMNPAEEAALDLGQEAR